MSKIVIYHDYIYATYRLVYTHDAYDNMLPKTWDSYHDGIWHNWGYTGFSYEQYTANSDDTIPAVNELQLSVYPNPFRENLQISTWAKQSQPAKMEIYNLKGQLVKTYDSFTNLSVAWDGKNSRGTAVSNGIYYLKVSAGGKSQTRKVILLK